MDDMHDFVTIDKDRVNRCSWCGTLQSKTWIPFGDPESPSYYCSRNCELAASVDARRRTTINCILYGLLSITVGMAISFVSIDFAGLLIFIGCVMLLSTLCLISDYRVGQKIRRIIPMGSRKDNRSLEVLFLKKAQTRASCPKCGGNIDLTQIGPKRIFTCSYCGVEGILEWPRENT